MRDFLQFLRETSYPGRGIVVGRDRVYYFIMGRSANSRNRIFVPTEDGIRTEAYDPTKLEDPSLIIYHPVRRVGDTLIVTNGDQTDTIRDYVLAGKSWEEALATREFEPDAPNYTPRISALLETDGSFRMSILRRDAEDGSCRRDFFAYPPCEAGEGRFLSTYQGDGNPLPSFQGGPMAITMPEPEEVWAALDPENKIALYANVGGTVRIFNKNLGD